MREETTVFVILQLHMYTLSRMKMKENYYETFYYFLNLSFSLLYLLLRSCKFIITETRACDIAHDGDAIDRPRSSLWRCSIKIIFEKILKFPRKTPTPASLFNKAAGLNSCEYCKIFKSTYFEEHLRTAASIIQSI